MTKTDPRESLGYQVADLHRLFGRVFDRRVAHLELTRVQWRALKHLGHAEGVTQVELADRLVESAPTYLLSGSSLNSWWLRALGAKVGKEVVIGSMTLRAPDLLSIGDNVSVGNAVNFENARVERGRLLLGQISIGDAACNSSYAIREGNTKVGAFGHLEGQSALADGVSVPAGRPSAMPSRRASWSRVDPANPR